MKRLRTTDGSPNTPANSLFYTAQLASFTHWLFVATIGLAVVGIWQGVNIERSVNVANRAADEARDAIIAAQAAATAANAHVRAAQEANRINREALISTNRPWIRIDMDVVKGEPVIITSEHIEAAVQIKVTNIGRSPATEVSFKIQLFPDLVAAKSKG
jgi:hypothetical protein